MFAIGSRVRYGPPAGTGSNVTPSLTAYRNAVFSMHRRFEGYRSGDSARWPRIESYTAWNEPNVAVISPPDILADPRIPARYARTFAAFCAANDGPQRVKCRVVAGDFGENSFLRSSTDDERSPVTGVVVRAGAYLRKYKLALGGWVPRQWAFHSYGCPTGPDFEPGGDDNSDDVLNAFIVGTQRGADPSPNDPNLWLTETGPRVDEDVLKDEPLDETKVDELDAETGRRTARILDYCMTRSSRIRRAYFYNWKGDRSFDSDPDGQGPGQPDGIIRSGELRFDSGLTDAYRQIPGNEFPPRYRSRAGYCVLYQRFASSPTPDCPGR